MKTEGRSLSEIHLAVLLFGVSGLFGKLLALPPMTIVLGRVFFSSIFLFGLLNFLKIPLRLHYKRHFFYLAAMGALLAVHWSSFYQAIQLSTVAAGLLSFSTFPVFVTFLEPRFFHEKIRKADILAAVITLAGPLLVTPAFRLNDRATQGILWGVFSGFAYALLSLLNRRYAAVYPGALIAFYEQLAAAVLLLPFFICAPQSLRLQDALLLALLGIVFTGVAHSLFIAGLRRVRAQAAGIISCLEPVYGILLAWIFLGEFPSPRGLLGGAVILGAVIYSSRKSRAAENGGSPARRKENFQ